MSRQILISSKDVVEQWKIINELLKSRHIRKSTAILNPWFTVLTHDDVDLLVRELEMRGVCLTLSELNDNITEGAYQGVSFLYYLMAIAPCEAVITDRFDRVIKISEVIIRFITKCDETSFFQLIQQLSRKKEGVHAFGADVLYHLTYTLCMLAEKKACAYDRIADVFVMLIGRCEPPHLGLLIHGLSFSILMDAVKHKPDLQEKIIFRLFKKLAHLSKNDIDRETAEILYSAKPLLRDMLRVYLNGIHDLDHLKLQTDRDTALGALIDYHFFGLTSNTRMFVNKRIGDLTASAIGSNRFILWGCSSEVHVNHPVAHDDEHATFCYALRLSESL